VNPGADGILSALESIAGKSASAKTESVSASSAEARP
jgi:hypothetical protein